MDSNPVTLFVGGHSDVPSEKQLIARLRADLERADGNVTLYTNFFTPRPNERQIDLIVDLPWRTAHVEIKGLDQDLPLFGGPNGKWRRGLPDGSEREEGNYGRQVLDGTYAITDTMRAFARKGHVADADDFRKTVDGILCLWPGIPPRSETKVPRFVTVVGYDDLLARLLEPGPKVPWSDGDWAEWVRRLGLYQPEADAPEEAERRASLGQVADYRARARVAFATALPPFVDLKLRTGGDNAVRVGDLDQLVGTGSAVVIDGQSGTGKTRAAQHLALRHCDQGRLIVWARCSEYEQGRFGDLLNRSAAPYSAARRSDLMRAAAAAGAGVTVILDALDGCPEDLRGELIQQLNAFRLRCPVAVVITTNVESPDLELLAPMIASTELPSEEARQQILLAHGSRRPELISAAFTTPYELGIAAACEMNLDSGAGVAELHDAYVRRFAPTEQVRAGLRRVATLLHKQLRSSIDQFATTRLLLGAAGGNLSTKQIDEVLDCKLLVVERHRVRFRHDLLAQFLAAEALVHEAADGTALGLALAAPANHHLVGDALGIEQDPRRRWDAIVQLGDASAITAAVHGGYGNDCRQRALDSIRTVLRRAKDLTRPDLATFEPHNLHSSRWIHSHTWTHAEIVILSAAGSALADGLLADEIIPLLDATDAMCHQVIAAAPAELEAPRSTVFAATYGQGGARDEHALPATVVAFACEIQSMTTRFRDPPKSAAVHLSVGASDTSYGRLYAATMLIDPRCPGEQAEFASLLERCWNSSAYHLQLEALQRAQYFWDSAEPARSRIVQVLESISPNHWALSSLIVEALAAFGEIHTEASVDTIHDDIRRVIAQSDEQDACELANSILARRYDPEEIVGPYTEAIETLTRPERARLTLMAIQATQFSLFLADDLTDLAALVPTGDTGVDAAITKELRCRAGVRAADNVMPTEGVAASLAATISWAVVDPEDLPFLEPGAGVKAEAWHQVMALVAGVVGHVCRDARAVWAYLQDQPAETVRALAEIEAAERSRPWRAGVPIMRQLIAAWPDEFKRIATWAVANPPEAEPDEAWLSVQPFAIRALGDVGDHEAVELLEPYSLDSELGPLAVDAIRRIHGRLGAW
jgi:hypothetical protein